MTPSFDLIASAKIIFAGTLFVAMLTIVPIGSLQAADRTFTYTIKSGDTLAKALDEGGLDGQQAYRISQALAQHIDLKSIRPGQTVLVEQGIDGTTSAVESIDPASSFRVVLDLGFNGVVEATLLGSMTTSQFAELTPEVRTVSVQFKVNGSVIDSAVEAGVSPEVILELSETLESQVNFKRDFVGGENISLKYEEAIYVYGDQRKRIPRAISYASVQTTKGVFELVRIGSGAEQKLVISKDGKLVLSMRLPVPDARLSSAFGRRNHPVLAGWMMHKGVDFAARKGDDVFVVENGVVERAGREGGFGRVVRVRHPNGMETIYAHLSKIPQSITPGTGVSRGDVIGEVGSSGLATSPNLHFEVRQGSSSLNPIKAATLDRLQTDHTIASKTQSPAN